MHDFWDQASFFLFSFGLPLTIYVVLQIVVPIKLRGRYRMIALSPLAVIFVAVGLLQFLFRRGEGGWAGFPSFLFLLVVSVFADIFLVLYWLAVRKESTKV